MPELLVDAEDDETTAENATSSHEKLVQKVCSAVSVVHVVGRARLISLSSPQLKNANRDLHSLRCDVKLKLQVPGVAALVRLTS